MDSDQQEQSNLGLVSEMELQAELLRRQIARTLDKLTKERALLTKLENQIKGEKKSE